MKAELGGDDGLVAFPLQGASQNPLAVPRAVIGGRIEEVDAEIKRGVDGADRLVIVDITPTARPVQPVPGTADRPTSQSHRADANIGAPKHSL